MSQTIEILLVGAGGFFGAISRYLIYLIERAYSSYQFPLGTLCINAVGCFLAGIMMAKIEQSESVHRYLLLLSSMGFLGAFTTFSAFSVESLQLIRSHQPMWALLNMGANVLLGIGAVWLGRFVYSNLA